MPNECFFGVVHADYLFKSASITFGRCGLCRLLAFSLYGEKVHTVARGLCQDVCTRIMGKTFLLCEFENLPICLKQVIG